jgi:hypothetical protein
MNPYFMNSSWHLLSSAPPPNIITTDYTIKTHTTVIYLNMTTQWSNMWNIDPVDANLKCQQMSKLQNMYITRNSKIPNIH